MSAVKRHLEALTDELLDSVRVRGSAVMVEALPVTAPAAHSRTLAAVIELGSRWLCAPDTEQLDRLGRELAAWQAAPPADLAAAYLDAQEEAAEQVISSLSDWLEPWGLQLCWETVGLCAVPTDDEWATALEQGIWRKRRGK